MNDAAIRTFKPVGTRFGSIVRGSKTGGVLAGFLMLILEIVRCRAAAAGPTRNRHPCVRLKNLTVSSLLRRQPGMRVTSTSQTSQTGKLVV